MRYLVGGMMLAFALAGAGLLFDAARQFLKMALRFGSLKRAEGVVLRVLRDHRMPIPSATRLGRGRRPQSRFYPVIAFDREDGRRVEFKSEFGEVGEASHYEVGQAVEVLYDPAERVSPRVRRWFAVWGVCLMEGIAAAVFGGGAALIYVAFGKRIFGGG